MNSASDAATATNMPNFEVTDMTEADIQECANRIRLDKICTGAPVVAIINKITQFLYPPGKASQY